MLGELDAGNRLSLMIFVFSVPLFWARLAGTSGLDQRADIVRFKDSSASLSQK